jgi:hypothetical protein
MNRSTIARAAFALLLSVLALGVRADVWGFVDAHGVAHFASERLDERYELFFRGGRPFDTLRDMPPPPADEPAAQAASAEPGKLELFFEVSPRYLQVRDQLREAARAHAVDFDLLRAVISAESGFDPQAVSPKGAIGLMQVMPATAQRWGLAGDARTPLEKKLTDTRTNLRIGTRYLRHLIDLFPGQLDLAVAAYNAGEGAVQRAGHRIPNCRETQAYVKTVLQLYAQLKPPLAPITAAAVRPAPAPTPVTVGAGAPPRRVRMQLPGVPAGGAIGRGNMPPSTMAAVSAMNAMTALAANAAPAADATNNLTD